MAPATMLQARRLQAKAATNKDGAHRCLTGTLFFAARGFDPVVQVHARTLQPGTK